MAKPYRKTIRRRKVRLLVADENRMNCQLLIGALHRCRYVKVVARANRSEEALTEVKNNHPNVALISGNLQDGSLTGFAVVRELRSSNPEIRTILLLDSAEKGWVIDAFRAGAKGIFCRDDSLELLSKCILCVHEGQIWANSVQIEAVLDAFARVAPPLLTDTTERSQLSKREQEVANLVVEGLSNREISSHLRLSEHTVKNYVFHIFQKLGMSSRVELVLYARSLDKSLSGKVAPLEGISQSNSGSNSIITT
jgi:DNA-binding NarL/FixJ family response regulator